MPGSQTLKRGIMESNPNTDPVLVGVLYDVTHESQILTVQVDYGEGETVDIVCGQATGAIYDEVCSRIGERVKVVDGMVVLKP
jgi:hypothetical protein